MAEFFTRFQVPEIIRVGPQLEGAVQQHAATDSLLVSEVAAITQLAATVASLTRPGAVLLTELDFARDELIRALELSAEAGTHRIDLPQRIPLAQQVLAVLFADGYGWVNAPLGQESVRIHQLLTDALKPAVAAALAALDLQVIVTALAEVQEKFEAEERVKGGSADAAKAVTRQIRQLRRQFDRKLDLFVSLVQDRYPVEDHTKVAVQHALLQPLVDATARVRASQSRSATPATPPAPPADPSI